MKYFKEIMRGLGAMFCIVAIAVVVTPAFGTGEDLSHEANNKRCIALANLAYPVADSRNQGYSINTVMSGVRTSTMSYVPRTLAENMIYRAYDTTKQFLTKSELAAYSYGTCMDYLKDINYR